MYHCYCCGNELNKKNRSKEHIIPNAIGGFLKSDKLLCKTYNSDYGDGPDSDLAKQLNSIANFLNIKRDRGRPQPEIGVGKDTGTKYKVYPGGKPELEKPTVKVESIDDKSSRISITARNENEFKSILQGLKKKYPKIDVDNMLKEANTSSEVLEEMLTFNVSVGGEDFEKSIIKSVLNFYIFKGGNPAYVKTPINYLKTGANKIRIGPCYFDIYKPAKDEVIHSIIIKGIPSEQIIVGYIELYSVFGYLMILNDSYNGVDFSYSYSYDVFANREFNKKYAFPFNRESAIEVCEQNTPDFERIQSRMSRIISLGQRKNTDEMYSDLVSQAVKNTLGKYPEGCVITKDMTDELVNDLMKRLTPHIVASSRARMMANSR